MLVIIKAEDVRDGEPRWWCMDADHAAEAIPLLTVDSLTRAKRSSFNKKNDFAIVDRPAPTPAPAPGLDLEAIERAERAMTPGPWTAKGCSFQHGIVQRSGNGAAHGFQDDAPCSFDAGAANAAGIVSLRNAAPALIAEIRTLRTLRARLSESTAAAVGLAAEADGLRAEVARHASKLTEVRELIDSTEHESTCTIGPYGPGQNGADCNCLVGTIAAALEAL